MQMFHWAPVVLRSHQPAFVELLQTEANCAITTLAPAPLPTSFFVSGPYVCGHLFLAQGLGFSVRSTTVRPDTAPEEGDRNAMTMSLSANFEDKKEKEKAKGREEERGADKEKQKEEKDAEEKGKEEEKEKDKGKEKDKETAASMLRDRMRSRTKSMLRMQALSPKTSVKSPGSPRKANQNKSKLVVVNVCIPKSKKPEVKLYQVCPALLSAVFCTGPHRPGSLRHPEAPRKTPTRKRAGAGTGGTPRGRSSTRGQRDNCPTPSCDRRRAIPKTAHRGGHHWPRDCHRRKGPR